MCIQQRETWDQEPQHRGWRSSHMVYVCVLFSSSVDLSASRGTVLKTLQNTLCIHGAPDNEALPRRYRSPSHLLREFIFPRVEQRGATPIVENSGKSHAKEPGRLGAQCKGQKSSRAI